MVGNDIVDLKAARKASDWKRPRFLDKLFTAMEQRYIREAKCPFLMLWRLWSIKEASYKLYTQLHRSRFYNPKGFECSLDGTSATVKFKAFQCHVKSKSTSNYIISEASLDEKEMGSIIVKLKSTGPKAQSQELKAKLIGHVGEEYRLYKDDFDIPALSDGKKQAHISLTHHGRYGAFAVSSFSIVS